MFEQEIARDTREYSSILLKQQPYVTLTEILDETRVPESIKAFFAMEVNWWIYNESLDRAANARFEFASAELASLITYLEQVQFRYAQFDRDEFAQVMDSAVKMTYNYLCRPQTTLKWFIFRGQPTRPLDEVLLRMEAFSAYTYYRKVFCDWVDRKRRQREGLQAISASEFERVIRRIDDQILLSSTLEDLLEHMDALFLGLGVNNTVPVSALIVFFDDKNIQRLVQKLEQYIKDRSDRITRSEFVELLQQLLESAEDQPDEVFAEVYQNDALDEVVSGHLSKRGSPDGGTTSAGTVPPDTQLHTASAQQVSSERGVHQQMREDRTGVSESNGAPLTDTPEQSDGPSNTGDTTVPKAELGSLALDDLIDHQARVELSSVDADTPGSTSVAQLVTTRQPARKDKGRPQRATGSRSKAKLTKREALPDIRTYIDDKLHAKVLKKVFDKRQDDFDAFLDRLNAALDWKSAERVLRDEFLQRDVQPYSRTAIRLTDSVYARYMVRHVH